MAALFAFVAATVAPAANAAAPVNDNRAQAATLTTGVRLSANNVDATTEAGEVRTCAGVEYAGTVWFVWHASAVGDASFDAESDFTNVNEPDDTVLAVYRGASAAPLACNNDAGLPQGPSRLTLRVIPGDYFVQVGAPSNGPFFGEGAVTARAGFQPDLDLDGDGWMRPGDCDDANPAIHPGVVDIEDDAIDQDCDGRLAVDPDRDNDAWPRPGDCDDGNGGIHPGAIDVPDDLIDQDCTNGDAVNQDRDGDLFTRPKDCRDDVRGINPGAVDTPGNRIDEDCDGEDEPYPAMPSTVTASFSLLRGRLSITSLAVLRAPRGAKIVVRCRGKRRCGLRSTTRRIRRTASVVDLTRSVRRVRLRRKAELELVATKPGYVGQVVRWKAPRKLRKGPSRRNLCLAPGRRRPHACR